jgi:hypothetical protein
MRLIDDTPFSILSFLPGNYLCEDDVPNDLRQKLKERAARNRRSMTMEALVILETALSDTYEVGAVTPPTPYHGRFLLTDEWINQAKHEGHQ